MGHPVSHLAKIEPNLLQGIASEGYTPEQAFRCRPRFSIARRSLANTFGVRIGIDL